MILVVEDDPFLRSTAGRIFRDAGWQVAEADCAAAAIEVLTRDDGIDLMFSDIQMPGAMNGIGLAGWVRDNRPRVRIMLTTGGGFSVDARLCDCSVIPKPYRSTRIVDRARRLLGEAEPPSPERPTYPRPGAA